MFKEGNYVRFTKQSRFNEWKRNSVAIVEKIIVSYPENTSTLLLVRLEGQNELFWAYENELEHWYNQLKLWVD
jgi:hypothetical protein